MQEENTLTCSLMGDMCVENNLSHFICSMSLHKKNLVTMVFKTEASGLQDEASVLSYHTESTNVSSTIFILSCLMGSGP